MNNGNRLRGAARGLSHRLLAQLAPRVWAHLEPDVRRLSRQVANDVVRGPGREVAEDVARGHGRAIVAEMDRRGRQAGAEHAAIREQLREGLYWADDKTDLLGAALAAVEVRLAGVERAVAEQDTARSEALAAGGTPDVGTALTQARQALADVRTEHTRVRARLAVVASFEERLERLENGQPASGPRVPRVD